MDKPLDFTLEIGSPSTGAVDLGRKRDLYAELGAKERADAAEARLAALQNELRRLRGE